MRYQKYMDDNSCNTQNDTKSRILEAATELFLKKGYANVTTREIATAADINLGLIPYYFSTKVNLAKQVCLEVMDQANERYLPSLLTMPAAERMYISSVLTWYCLEQEPNASRFYYEFLDSTDALDTYTSSFVADSWSVIQSYQLDVAETDHTLYLCVMKASERTLVLKYYRHEFNLTKEQVVSILTAHYFFDIGLPDDEIARIIQFGENYCKNFVSQFNK